jgi:hypothetical protein
VTADRVLEFHERWDLAATCPHEPTIEGVFACLSFEFENGPQSFFE